MLKDCLVWDFLLLLFWFLFLLSVFETKTVKVRKEKNIIEAQRNEIRALSPEAQQAAIYTCCCCVYLSGSPMDFVLGPLF